MDDETPADLLLQVEGMTCDGCAAAVTRVVHRIDPGAKVAVDRVAARVEIRTGAEASTVAEALAKAGYPARALD